ncbi:NlpC/P60 family protein [Chelativorans sp. AA-79]|uniref:C40 family peptidase n=1 Tax=Chelativorans sp. AA-79 TaxID=3028735 RepID=UPI0023F8187A|nr:NlpC/P60 family protein [Chelativorans sp. AA-79]WEX09283.1 NlpC/P60 family protein [Chelativorans sp. AA-79]
MNALDGRLNAFRPDLADERLQGRVEAARFTAGESAMVAVPLADVHTAPDPAAGMDTQFLHGDAVLVFERRGGWAWVQGERDGYVGYVREGALGSAASKPTHIVHAARSFVYPEPDMKTPRSGAHSIGARLTVVEEVERRGTRYAVLDSGGAMIAKHIRPVSEHAADYVSVAEQLLQTPYLWGGVSGFGIDCSGLVQLSLFMAGRTVLRDTDMQEYSLGTPIEPKTLRRGDLVFWRGHVAIMTDEKSIVHANGYSMIVSLEPLAEAIRRIELLYGLPAGYRRIT